jgi:protein-disulfide isomerase
VFSRSWESATDREVIEVGVAAGADRAKFQTCLSASASAKSRLAQDVKDGFEANVRVTPTLIVNGQTLMNTNEFAQVVEAERRKVAGAGATTKK